MSRIHSLKTIQPHFDKVNARLKTFEVRKNDRNFQVGDILLLKEYDQETETFTDRVVAARAHHILEGGQFGIEPGYVVMSIEVV